MSQAGSSPTPTDPENPFWFDEDTLEIPPFLRVTGPREWHPPVKAGVAYVDPVQERQRELAANIASSKAARVKEKNARGFAKMQEKHPNERYVRPKRKDGRVVVPGHWVPK